MKCGTAKVQQSSGLSGMSELIPLLCKRCPGICQDSHRQNTGACDREMSLSAAESSAEGREGVSPPGDPARSTYCPLPHPREDTFVCPNLIWQTSTHKGMIYRSFVCFSPRAQLRQAEKLLLLLACMAFFFVLASSWVTQPPVALIHTKLSRTAE